MPAADGGEVRERGEAVDADGAVGVGGGEERVRGGGRVWSGQPGARGGRGVEGVEVVEGEGGGGWWWGGGFWHRLYGLVEARCGLGVR